MTADQYGRAREIFDGAEALSGDECESYLRDACEGDEQLRSKVDALLKARQEMGQFLEIPAVVWRDEKIGGFTIDEVIAEGGMGIVLKATQESPHRTVAIKLIRGGGFKKQVQQRFELEAEVLGRLDHPGVARIYEVGTADRDGVSFPYFVMEYIEGLPLTEYAEKHHLDERARIELMISICKAVHHAHLRGVVHRDLKPSNILVNEDGQTKVLDFGVARVTDADVQLTTAHTQVGEILGTLPYMSPEQVTARNEDLDLRSDIYSLGVLTFEMLTGRLPQPVKGKDLVEAIRLISIESPEALNSGGHRYGADLQTVVAKCLRKRPERRYDSAEAFAQDLRHYLNDEPVTARPASTIYQLKKFVRRNRVAAFWAALSLVFLIGGLFFSLAQWSTARDERNNAVTAAEEATELSDFLVQLLSSPDPRQQGSDVRVRDLLDQASEYAGTVLADRPAISNRIHQALGFSYRGLGMDDVAMKELEAAYRAASAVPGQAGEIRQLEALLDLTGLANETGDDDMVDSLLTAAKTLLPVVPPHDPLVDRHRMQSGILESYTGDKEVAEKILREAYEESSVQLGEEERVVRDLRGELGNHLLRAHKTEAAREILEQNIEVEIRLAGPDAPVTLKGVNNLGMVYRQLGDYPRARDMLARALDTKVRTLGPEHPSTATGHHNLALVLRELNELEEAESHHLPAVAVADTLFRPEDPRVPHFRSGYAGTLYRMERYADARRLHLESYERLVEIYGPDHARIQAIFQELADSCEALGYSAEAARWRVMVQ